MGECQETAGFLFSHPCGRAASSECVDCSKAVCAQHLKEIAGALVCVACAKALLDEKRKAGGRAEREQVERYQDDPYFYGSSRYEGYGSYRRGQWGYGYYSQTRHDPHDFTEADGESFASEGDEGWEQDMGGS